jgi:hypothetical protein
MPQAHLSAQWREKVAPLVTDVAQADVVNGTVRVGDWVRELPAAHHIQPCACVLCRPMPGVNRDVQVRALGRRDGKVFVVLDEGYECPALEVEKVRIAK